jgi:hypothetical protein
MWPTENNFFFSTAIILVVISAVLALPVYLFALYMGFLTLFGCCCCLCMDKEAVFGLCPWNLMSRETGTEYDYNGYGRAEGGPDQVSTLVHWFQNEGSDLSYNDKLEKLGKIVFSRETGLDELPLEQDSENLLQV